MTGGGGSGDYLDPMTFTYEHEPYYTGRYTGCANMNFLRQGFPKLSFDGHRYRSRQTDRIDRNKPRHFADGQKTSFYYIWAYVADSVGLILFNHSDVTVAKATGFGRITLNNAHYAVTDYGAIRKFVCDFLFY